MSCWIKPFVHNASQGPLTPTPRCPHSPPGPGTPEPQELKATSQRVRSGWKARPGQGRGLCRAHRGPIDVLPKLPRAAAKMKAGPNYSTALPRHSMPSAGAQAGAAKRAAGGAKAPRGAWEGIFHWLQARGPGTEKAGRQDGHDEQGDKVSSWLSPPDAHQVQSPQGPQGAQAVGGQSQLPAGRGASHSAP